MSRRKNESLPKNRVLRNTVYRLLLAAPALPLLACPGSEECVSGPITLTAEGIHRNPDGSLSCDNCPEHPQGAPLRTCNEATSDGGTKVVCTYVTCSNDGRRPEGLLEPRPGEELDSLLGALHAHVAWLEAASVPAFLRLADELTLPSTALQRPW
ncbi:hypothetical protein [Vitiosangium sp. GDMCC 1.1324]|uniref:hypothetical protein n=1 Tax=Vitiosangium sp. (strain GDMCC 1.1324) TaxID=2138576 RepID=UPI000D3BCB5C|nr:hypothetical protein [Vitiosangium sp. GDMCC 1.1324]PTL81563.1 hypothetical protein DAT35_21620 [Vitiosangium sp. GDMCC 1.1324]